MKLSAGLSVRHPPHTHTSPPFLKNLAPVPGQLRRPACFDNDVGSPSPGSEDLQLGADCWPQGYPVLMS